MLADRSPDVGEEIVPPDEPGERRGEVPDDGDACRGGDRAAKLERRQLRDDRRLEPLQLRAGVEALLLGEELPDALVREERVALSPASVLREHQLAPEPFAERVLSRELLDLSDDLAVKAGVEIGLDPILERIEAQPLEARRLRRGPILAFEAEERGSAPQRERFMERGPRIGRGAVRELIVAEDRELLEPQRVDPIRRHVESVARLVAGHGVAADRRPEPRDLMLQGVDRIGRFGARPQQIDQARGRDDPSALESEDRCQRALTPAREIDGASLAGDRESAEHTDGDGHGPPPCGCSHHRCRRVKRDGCPRCAGSHATDSVFVSSGSDGDSVRPTSARLHVEGLVRPLGR